MGEGNRVKKKNMVSVYPYLHISYNENIWFFTFFSNAAAVEK